MRRTKWTKRVVAIAISVSVLFASPGLSLAATSVPRDLQGHWAQEVIMQWLEEGKLQGYGDGTVRPDRPATRAELVAMINKSLQLEGNKEISFKDVKASHWFYRDLQIAAAHEYITGYADDTFRPNLQITREQLAVIISRLLKLEPSDKAAQYGDTKNLPSWSKGHVGAVIDQGLMTTNGKSLFLPAKEATRAEIITVLSRVSKQTSDSLTIDQGGVYGQESSTTNINGDVRITAPGVTLLNHSINGKLQLDASIGEGDVFLRQVAVKGATVIQGGGASSIHVESTTLSGVTINKANGKVRVVASGNSSIGSVTLQSGATLEESALTGQGEGFGEVVVGGNVPQGAVVRLAGEFKALEIGAPGLTIELAGGNVDTLHITSKAGQTTVKGQGTIARAKIDASGAQLERKPANVELAAGITATINGEQITEPAAGGPPPVIGGGGGGGGGGGDDSTDPEPPALATPNEVFPISVTAAAGSEVALTAAPSAGTTAWFAPAGTTSFAEGNTMTKLTGDGTRTSILAPAIAGKYKLYIVTAADTQASSAELTVTGSVSSQLASSLFVADRIVRGGESVTLVTSADNGLVAWFAPAGTLQFEEGALITKASGATIAAPTVEGAYRLFLTDASGTVQNGSASKLTVDNTAPRNNAAHADVITRGGKAVEVGQIAADAVSAWFAPPGTTDFTEGATMRQMTSGTILAAPTAEGSYKYYLVDAAGNVSAPSAWTLTVDNTAPNNANTLLDASTSVRGGSTITLKPGIRSGEQAWLAPAGTTSFILGPTITSSANGASIQAPAAEGVYHLFVRDEAGNVSAASNAAVTVDNTAPTTQNAVVFANRADQDEKLTLTNVPNGVMAWFAPAVTSEFAEGPTMTKSFVEGGSVKINAPTTVAIYKLFLIDEAGNVSLPSDQSLTVE